MANRNRPWFKFHAKDWSQDVRDRGLSPESRGVLIDMMAAMHHSEKYGYLKPDENFSIGLLIGVKEDVCEKCLVELLDKKAIQFNEKKGYYIKRMVEDERLYLIAVEAGEKGQRAKQALKDTLKPPLEGESKPPLDHTSDSDSNSNSLKKLYTKEIIKLIDKIREIDNFPKTDKELGDYFKTDFDKKVSSHLGL